MISSANDCRIVAFPSTKVSSWLNWRSIVLFLIGVASEFYGGVVNMIGHILIFLGLGGIDIGVRRRIFCAEIQYPQGKINLCSKNDYDPSLLAVCINKIKGGASEC
jgi:hypothetical protein